MASNAKHKALKTVSHRAYMKRAREMGISKPEIGYMGAHKAIMDSLGVTKKIYGRSKSGRSQLRYE